MSSPERPYLYCRQEELWNTAAPILNWVMDEDGADAVVKGRGVDEGWGVLLNLCNLEREAPTRMHS